MAIAWKQKTIFDGRAGDADGVTFTRDVVAYEAGVAVPVNTPRRKTAKAHAGRPIWSDSKANAEGGNSERIWAAGLDHDVQTRIVVSGGNGGLDVNWGSTDISDNNRSISNADIQTLLSSPTNTQYNAKATEVYLGCIIIWLERLESGVRVGWNVAISQDKLQTLTMIASRSLTGVRDTSGDLDFGVVPATAGRTWSVSIAPPANDFYNLRTAWFSYASYMDSKGWHIGLLKLTRSTDTGPWTVGDNRLLAEDVADSNSSLHGHCTIARIKTDGTGYVHFVTGDADLHQGIGRIDANWSAYETATATTTEVYGNIYSGGVKEPKLYGQPVALVPLPDGGWVGSGDLGLATVTRVGWQENASDPIVLTAPDIVHAAVAGGSKYDSPAILHARWSYRPGGGSVVWTLGGAASNDYHISTDGENFARLGILNNAQGVGNRLFCDGHKLVALSGADIYEADIPVVRVLNPISAYQGNTNYIDGLNWFNNTNGDDTIGPGNVRRQVEYVGGVYRFVDDQTLVPNAPSTPPVPGYTIQYFECNGDLQLGGYRLNNNNLADVPGGNHSATLRICKLNTDRGIPAELVWGLRGSGLRYDAQELWQLDWDGWQEFSSAMNLTDAGGNQNAMLEFKSRNTGSSGAHEFKCLVQAVQFGDGSSNCYTRPPRTAGNDERLLIPLDISSTDWTVAIVTERPNHAVADSALSDGHLLTLYSDATNHIVVTQDPTNAEIDVAVTQNGTTTTGVLDMPRLLTGDHLHLMVASGSGSTTVVASSPMGLDSLTVASAPTSQPVRLQNGNADQTSLDAMEWSVVSVADAKASEGDMLASLASLDFAAATLSTGGSLRRRKTENGFGFGL